MTSTDRSIPRSAVMIGTYDGVHIGHRKIIDTARLVADEHELSLVIVTFDRHPSAVVRPASTPLLLTGLEHKLELLRACPVDDVIVLHFDNARASESAEDFVATVIVGELHAELVVVGANFRFGRQQRGDVAMLQTIGKELGFAAEGLALVTDERSGDVVSSTRIRGLVRIGELEEATYLLGRPHEVRGILTELSGADRGQYGVVVDADICMPPPGTYVAAVSGVGQSVIERTVRVLDSGKGAPYGNAIVLDSGVLTTGTRCAVQFLSPAH